MLQFSPDLYTLLAMGSFASLGSILTQGVSASALAPAWAILNATVGGRLSPGVPWSEPCFSEYNGNVVQPDSAQCSFVQNNFFDSHLPRTNAFGGYSAIQYESCMATGDQCELDWMNPTSLTAFAPPQNCKQGSVPDFYIDVEGKDDVIAAYAFSLLAKVTLVVKNTGHDFKGRSSAPHSLALWMHNMKAMIHVPNFIPDTCRVNGVTAITIGAGVQFGELYQFADDHNLEVIGGSDQSVGAAGGYLQGGGHSPITPSAGMGVDRVLQYRIVTPDGVYRTANACQNKDLFFALRGGGGGTFGVVLEATILATPARSYRIASINWPVSDVNLKQVLSIFLENATTFANQGWGGYLTPTIGSLVMLNPVLNAADAEKSMKPLMDLTRSFGGVSNVTTVNTFQDWFTLFVDNKQTVQQSAVGLPNAMTSRLIPQLNHATAKGRAQLLDALMNAFNNTVFSQIHFTTPFGFKSSDGSDTSVNPIWRTSLYQVILVNAWLVDSTLADRQAAYAQSTKAVSFLRNITPGSGAYHNEADIHEPDHEISFWGAEIFNKLVPIKRKYDPLHILDCWHCIGWKGTSPAQYKCYI
ncbi:FAD-binding domain-containing protein [Crassisporium funariophilum]|nr:FAD-binding domain-containing protein [Crassisporium funariophilum]